MKNFEIIEGLKKENGFTPEDIFHTYQEWKELGYQVQKGEKAKFQGKIFLPIRDKQDKEKIKGYFLKTASFFGVEQVKKIEEEKEEELDDIQQKANALDILLDKYSYSEVSDLMSYSVDLRVCKRLFNQKRHIKELFKYMENCNFSSDFNDWANSKPENIEGIEF